MKFFSAEFYYSQIAHFHLNVTLTELHEKFSHKPNVEKREEFGRKLSKAETLRKIHYRLSLTAGEVESYNWSDVYREHGLVVEPDVNQATLQEGLDIPQRLVHFDLR